MCLKLFKKRKYGVYNFPASAFIGLEYLWTGDLLSYLFDMCDLAAIGRLMNSIFHVQKIEKYAGRQKI